MIILSSAKVDSIVLMQGRRRKMNFLILQQMSIQSLELKPSFVPREMIQEVVLHYKILEIPSLLILLKLFLDKAFLSLRQDQDLIASNYQLMTMLLS